MKMRLIFIDKFGFIVTRYPNLKFNTAGEMALLVKTTNKVQAIDYFRVYRNLLPRYVYGIGVAVFYASMSSKS